MRMIFIFLDGVGIGKSNSSNPFYLANSKYLPFFNKNNILPDGTPLKAIDPLLGIEGLPQSATGQTTLFTGKNIPSILNEHRGSYPNQLMRKIILKKNLFSILKENKIKAKFINVYPVYAKLFTTKHIRINEDGKFLFSNEFPTIFKRRISTTTCMMLANNAIPFKEKDISNENSIYQDFSNKLLIEKGLKLQEFSPEKAAEIIFKLSRKYDFILYEYFQTDIFGHNRSFKDCLELIKKLDRLIGKLISLLNNNQDTLLITSDHGNIEDCSTKSHTTNPVPIIIWGNKSDKLRERIRNIADVTPAIEKFFI